MERSETREETLRDFHRIYYGSGVCMERTHWLGVPISKCPLDLWLYQEIIHRTGPDVIVECGTGRGGSALFLASMCDLVGNGRVVTVDIRECRVKSAHARIEQVMGSSTDQHVVERIRKGIRGGEKVLVILDSDHRKDHVLGELRAYGPLVTPGSYLIVEDTNINGHPAAPGWGPGPAEAVEEFLRENPGFRPDPEMDKFFMSFNPGGYLIRTA